MDVGYVVSTIFDSVRVMKLTCATGDKSKRYAFFHFNYKTGKGANMDTFNYALSKHARITVDC